MSLDAQIETALDMTPAEVTGLVAAMPHDDRVDLLKRIPDACRQAVMPALAQAEREDIRRLSSYPEGTAGAVMTSEYASLSPGMTAGEAIGKLRLEARTRRPSTTPTCFDEARRLVGFVSLKDLILARPDSLVTELMNREVISARAGDDQEEVVRKIARYDLLALPVVDDRGVLVGIVTHDDAIDVLHQEHTEDMEKFAAITGSHEGQAYLSTTALAHFRNRAFWVVLLAALGLVSGFIISSFESTLANLLILTLYMPISPRPRQRGQSVGHGGHRALTWGISGRATRFGCFSRNSRSRPCWGASWSFDLRQGLVSVPWDGFARGRHLAKVGLVVGLALCAQVITATILGAALPILAVRLGRDPAWPQPLLTTLVDITVFCSISARPDDPGRVGPLRILPAGPGGESPYGPFVLLRICLDP